MNSLISALSLALSLAFFLYGYNCYYMLYHMRRYAPPPRPRRTDFAPDVAVHLPIFNERYVVSRLVEACARMADRYGPSRTRIVVLDDSDDDTAGEVDRVVAWAVAKGYRVEALRRGCRSGFKAGALQYALERTSEEFIAVFDADFLPGEDFLVSAMPYFEGEPDLAIVQSRWEHINEAYSSLTRAISLGIDVHFFVEQAGRSSAGVFQNFNGSGGIMRRSALAAAGGWQADTLAEDLDMSYRIQLAGGRILYLRDLSSPAEVPSTLPSYKRQQARWANGSLRTAKKLLPSIVAMDGIGARRFVQAFIHLTYYLVQPLMLASFLFAAGAAFLGRALGPSLAGATVSRAAVPVAGADPAGLAFTAAVIACTIAGLLYPLAAIKARGRSIAERAGSIGLLLLIGFGLCLSNSVEAAKALFSKRIWAFSRTPKYAIKNAPDDWRGKRYQVPIDGKVFAEACLAIVGFAAAFFALRLSAYALAFALLVYATSFAYVAALCLIQSRPERGA